jgi:hypothetical protein
MPRCSAAWRSTGAGSTTLPIGSLFGVTTVTARVAEVGVFNTTSTAIAIALRKVTATGTQGTGQTELCEDDDAYTPLAQAFDTHTVAPTFTTGNLRVVTLGASVGSGVIWTFGPKGLIVPKLTTSGIAIVPLVGTGQICDIYFAWDE